MLTKHCLEQLASIAEQKLCESTVQAYNRYTGQLQDMLFMHTLQADPELSLELHTFAASHEESIMLASGPALPIYCVEPLAKGKIIGTLSKDGKHCWQILQAKAYFLAMPLIASEQAYESHNLDTLLKDLLE